MELIHVEIHNPKKYGNDRSEQCNLRKFYCDRPNECEAYHGGCCMNATGHSVIKCPYSKTTIEYGVTPRAKSFDGWINDRESLYSEYLNKLRHGPYPHRVFKIGSEWVIPYSYVTLGNNVFGIYETDYVHSTPYPVLSELNEFTFSKIYHHIPVDKNGGRCASYQEHYVERIVDDFIKYYPETRDIIASVVPYIRSTDEMKSCIGKLAILKTLNQCNVEYNYKSYYWNGEYMEPAKNVYDMTFFDNVVEKLYPSDNLFVSVTDIDQINDDTVFVE